MTDAVLDPAEVAALFRDYRALAGSMQIQLRNAPGLVLPHPSPTLDDAESLLLSGSIRGMQLRYQFNGRNWCDTLMPIPLGVRLVRISQQEYEPMPSSDDGARGRSVEGAQE
jgi:hypothetical protein